METEHGKLFVGGVSLQTTEETLRQYFGKYGEVKELEIPRDRITGNGRGFGFVNFTDVSVISEVLKYEHIILGRKVEVKLARPKGERHQNRHGLYQSRNNGLIKYDWNGNCFKLFSTKKIFVGGLPPSLTEEEFKNYFESYGAITDVVVMYDKVNDRPRGFGFITFESEEAVDNVLQKKYHKLNDSDVEVKRAEPKDKISGHACSYCWHNIGLGLERLSFSNSYGLHLPYGLSGVISSACMLPYGSVLGNSYGAYTPYFVLYPAYYEVYQVGFTGHSNSAGYPVACSSSNWNRITYGSGVFHPIYVKGGGHANDSAGGPVDMTGGGGGSYEGHTMSTIDDGGYVNGLVSGSVDVTDAGGSYQGSATSTVNHSSNKRESGGDSELPAHTILQPALTQTDDALCSESGDTEHQKGGFCQSTPCKSGGLIYVH